MATKYQKRISGPLLHCIDIRIEMPRVNYEKLSRDRMGETSESIRKCVQAARNIQQRFASSQSDIICNANMRIGEIRYCVLKLARTIADGVGSEGIQSTHLAEVLQCHPKLMMG